MALNLLTKSVNQVKVCSSILFNQQVNRLLINHEQVRFRSGKHWDPKFAKLRGKKFVHVKLPDPDEINQPAEDITTEQIRAKLKERGLLPERPWIESPIYLSATGGIFEAYVPPEGDGKVSVISTQGAKQKLEYIEKKSKSMMAVRKVRNYEEDFEFHSFLREAQEIYINAHTMIMKKDKEKLPLYITERAYPEVTDNIADKTIHWKFIDSIEPPKVVHVRCTDIISKDNIFGQVTVRFHTRQMLAVYDRFGRLIHGSESLEKDVLEYIVFEKHLSNKYGAWRIHDKIIPDWMPPKEPMKKTYIQEYKISESSVVPTKQSEVTKQLENVR